MSLSKDKIFVHRNAKYLENNSKYFFNSFDSKMNLLIISFLIKLVVPDFRQRLYLKETPKLTINIYSIVIKISSF